MTLAEAIYSNKPFRRTWWPGTSWWVRKEGEYSTDIKIESEFGGFACLKWEDILATDWVVKEERLLTAEQIEHAFTSAWTEIWGQKDADIVRVKEQLLKNLGF